jgi:hypothetical protein
MRLTKNSLCPICPERSLCKHADNRTKCEKYIKAVKSLGWESSRPRSGYERENMPVHTTTGEMKGIIEEAFTVGFKSGYIQGMKEAVVENPLFENIKREGENVVR